MSIRMVRMCPSFLSGMFAPAQTPQLSILHLMLWTFCSAVYLSLMRAVFSIQGELPDEYAGIQGATSVIQGIFTGAVLMGALVLVSTRVRSGPPMLRQPGHWLLFVSALFNLTCLPFILSAMLLQNSHLDGTVLVMPALIALYLVPTIAHVFAAAHQRLRRWKIVFIALAVTGLVQCFAYAAIYGFNSWIGILFTIHSLGNLLIPVAVLVLSIIDLAAGRRYDWLHWTGVTTHVAGASLTLLWIIGTFSIH